MKSVRKYITFIMLFAYAPVFAQKIPSGVNLNRLFVDTKYVDSIITVRRVFLAQVEQLPRSIMRDTLKLQAYILLSYIYRYKKSEVDSSLFWAEKTNKESSAKLYSDYFADGLVKRSEYYLYVKKDYVQAQKYLQEIISSNAASTKQKILAKRLIAQIYDTTDNPTALKYIDDLIKEIKNEKIPDSDKNEYLYRLYSFAGGILDKKKEYQKSIESYAISKSYLTKFNNGIVLAILNFNQSELFIKTGNYDEALKLINEAVAIYRLQGKTPTTHHILLAKVMLGKQKLPEAIFYANSIKKKAADNKSLILMQEIELVLFEANKQLLNFQPALEHYQSYIFFRDSLERMKKSSEIIELEKKYSFEQLQNLQTKEQLIEKLKIEKLELEKLRMFSQKQEAEQLSLERKFENESLNSKNKVLENLSVLNDQRNKDKLRQITIKSLQSSLENQKKIRWFVILSAAAILALLFVFIKIRQRQIKTKNDYTKKESQFQQKISQTEITALRAQMNPHFIFNCLNSIQLFTAQNEAEKASEYLSKFSRLIRLVLENSRSEKVTLENELETLRLYIEMEAMRFKGKVSYHINIAEGIDTGYIQIPPLLVQPFVENAIWHGLMHKEEGGIVKVEVTQPNENLLHIEISDDGIGREKAAEFKSKSATVNKSFGMKVTNERIELINQLYNSTTKVQVFDLNNQQGQATGTKVVVEIPI